MTTLFSGDVIKTTNFRRNQQKGFTSFHSINLVVKWKNLSNKISALWEGLVMWRVALVMMMMMMMILMRIEVWMMMTMMVEMLIMKAAGRKNVDDGKAKWRERRSLLHSWKIIHGDLERWGHVWLFAHVQDNDGDDVVSYPTRWSLLFIYGFLYGPSKQQRNIVQLCTSDDGDDNRRWWWT